MLNLVNLVIMVRVYNLWMSKYKVETYKSYLVLVNLAFMMRVDNFWVNVVTFNLIYCTYLISYILNKYFLWSIFQIELFVQYQSADLFWDEEMIE